MSTKETKSVAWIVRLLRQAVASEMEAANEYSGIIESLESEGHKGDLIERLKAIMRDEEEHAGSLLYVIGELDNAIVDAMARGAEGK